MKVAIIIPVFNRRETTLSCLKQIDAMDTCGVVINVVVVDDGSTDGTASAIHAEFPSVVVLEGDGNLWWTGAINMGVEYALARGYAGVHLLNDDLNLDKSAFCELYKVVRNNADALVSSLKMRQLENGVKEILTAGFSVCGGLCE